MIITGNIQFTVIGFTGGNNTSCSFRGKNLCQSEFLVVSNQKKTSLTWAEKCCPMRTVLPLDIDTMDVRFWMPPHALPILDTGILVTTSTTPFQSFWFPRSILGECFCLGKLLLIWLYLLSALLLQHLQNPVSHVLSWFLPLQAGCVLQLLQHLVPFLLSRFSSPLAILHCISAIWYSLPISAFPLGLPLMIILPLPCSRVYLHAI